MLPPLFLPLILHCMNSDNKDFHSGSVKHHAKTENCEEYVILDNYLVQSLQDLQVQLK